MHSDYFDCSFFLDKILLAVFLDLINNKNLLYGLCEILCFLLSSSYRSLELLDYVAPIINNKWSYFLFFVVFVFLSGNRYKKMGWYPIDISLQIGSEES